MTPTMKGLLAMLVWTMFSIGLLYIIGVGDHYRDPVWAILTAIAFLIILMVNFYLFFKIAGFYPFAWFKDEVDQ